MVIGIDAGAKFIKAVKKDEAGDIINICREHNGNPELAVTDILNGLEPAGDKRIIFTGHFGEYLCGRFPGSFRVDEIMAVISAQRHFSCGCRIIVNVGAGSIKYIELDHDGNFSSYRENSLCAAGTGSFLDEQMHRLGFDYEALANLSGVTEPPDIATRCAVFAKSDLIHRQQEGYSPDEMWNGLCRGVVNTMLHSVFHGNIPDEKILFCGGIFLNPLVRYWLAKRSEWACFHDSGNYFSAAGAFLAASDESGSVLLTDRTSESRSDEEDNGPRILSLSRSCPPAISPAKKYERDGNEVRIHGNVASLRKAALGIDIGSTSTKCVIIDMDTDNVLIDIYRKTGGNPIHAASKLFSALKEILPYGAAIERSATTGSGRRLVGEIIGADLIINEISAHFKGAKFFDPDIETIFEIGGQDSKYIRGAHGAVVDCNMNFVCAAGTGSFIEEQAGRLGCDVREIGDLTLGRAIPHASDRCTVFMEQDINKLLREGRSREEALAGVIYSIAKNYLHRVVGSRPVTGEKIFFQGATARNKGLVAAFEILLNREIVVSPYCHVMGAFGAALLAAERSRSVKSRFRGLDIFSSEVRLDYVRCGDCANKCKITVARVGGSEEVTWGYMCGRESLKGEKKKRSADHFLKVQSMINSAARRNRDERPDSKGGDRKRIGIPMTLSMYNYLPFWQRFFDCLGFDVELSGKSTPELKSLGVRISKSDFCFPIKIAFAHIYSLAAEKKTDAVFFPAFISEKAQRNKMPRVFCPYVISYPSIAGNAINMPVPVLSPSIDFRLDESLIIDELHKTLSCMGADRKEISGAYRSARANQKEFLKKRYEYGQVLLSRMREGKKPGIVFIGRPYNLYDRVINLGLTERFMQYDAELFPYECLLDPDDTKSDVYHMYWNYGERILYAARKIKAMEDVYPVYFTNFGCGPDSFILTRFEKIMQGKPYLIIELDEHGSETGYLTRIEAFMDVVAGRDKKRTPDEIKNTRFRATWKKKGKKLWIPSLHEMASPLFAAGFRAWGFDSEALPMENNISLETGRQGVRGSECLPAHSTIGAFIKKLRDIDADPGEHALFMPTAEGPCRFGQYSVLHRHILDRSGLGKSMIFAPSSVNSYMGMTNSLRVYLWDLIITGDLLLKYICKIRPYEINAGETDRITAQVMAELVAVAERRGDMLDALRKSFEALSQVPVSNEKRPIVGIVGEIYVRCNPFCNNNLIRSIESYGGEAWLSPMSEWILYTAWMERYLSALYKKNFIMRSIVNLRTIYLFNRIHKFEHALSDFIGDRMEPSMERVLDYGRDFLPLIFEGEAILTMGRAVAFIEDGAGMVANCAPFGCMPGNITNSLFHDVQKKYGKSILTLFYDGESEINRVVGVYLNNIKRKSDEKELEMV